VIKQANRNARSDALSVHNIIISDVAEIARGDRSHLADSDSPQWPHIFVLGSQRCGVLLRRLGGEFGGHVIPYL
jgi:hypothetical protein